MPIATTCPNCKALFRLPEEMAGRKVKCEKCACLFVVPMAEADTMVPGVPVPTEADVIEAEPAKPRGPASSMPLPPMPIDSPAAPPATPPPEPDDDAQYSDGKGKPPPLRKRDADDRSSRSRRDEKPKPKSSSTTMTVLLGVLGFGALACLTCAGGTGIWYLARNEEVKKARPPIAKDGMVKDFVRKDFVAKKEIAKADGFRDFAKKDALPKDFNDAFKDLAKKDDDRFFQVVQLPNPPAVPIKAKLDKDGSFTNHNQITNFDVFIFVNNVNKHYKAYSIVMEKDQTYQIDMISNVGIRFDSYLYVLDDAKRTVAFDDDSGGNLNARILFTPKRTATYQVLATTFGAGSTGNYTLLIQRFK